MPEILDLDALTPAGRKAVLLKRQADGLLRRAGVDPFRTIPVRASDKPKPQPRCRNCNNYAREGHTLCRPCGKITTEAKRPKPATPGPAASRQGSSTPSPD